MDERYVEYAIFLRFFFPFGTLFLSSSNMFFMVPDAEISDLYRHIECIGFVYFWLDSPPVDQGLLIHEVYRSHNDAPQSVGLLWASDQLVPDTSTLQHTTLTTDINASRWNSNPQSQQASDRRPTPWIARPLGPANV
jgi:hypothetical protein